MNNPWEQITRPARDMSARRVDHTHPLDLFWAQDQQGHYLFVYDFDSEPDSKKVVLPDLEGIKTTLFPVDERLESNRLVLCLREKCNWELFFALCNDLVQMTKHTQTSAEAVVIVLRRLARWHEFLKKSRSDLLSEDRIKGLLGELLFILNYLIPVFGAEQSVTFWQGPEGMPQDFNVNDAAIEVKCQSGASSPSVRITSAEQLSPQLPKMYLFVVTLGKTPKDSKGVLNLPLLVKHIREVLGSDLAASPERFNDLLYMTGYIDSDRYLEYSYILAGEKTYQVVDGFPRICTEDLHAGITRVSYSIALSECEPYVGCPDWMEVTS